MHKILVFLMEFFLGLVVRSVQTALFSAAAALPVLLLFRVDGCSGMLGEWFFLARHIFAVGVVLYLVVRMVRLLVMSWRNEL